MSDKSGQIDTVMHESRLFTPSREFSQRATIQSMDQYQALWDEAKADPEAFWGKQQRFSY